MLELLTLIGSAGAGKAFGIASDLMSSMSHAKEQEKAREFKKSLADKGELKSYMDAIHKDEDGKPSLLSITLCVLYIMFAFTACSACLYCFYMAFGEVTIKDPNQQQSSFRFFLFETKWSPKGVLSLSPMGLGYLILHPLLFILSMVSTGSRPTRR